MNLHYVLPHYNGRHAALVAGY